MSELTKKMTVGSSNVSFYTTSSEAGRYGNYGPATVDGVTAYYPLGTGASEATGSGVKTSLKATKGGTAYYVLTKTLGTKVLTSSCYEMSSVYPSTYSTMTSLPDTLVFDSNLTSIEWIFSGCSSLETLDVRSFNISQLTDISDCFRDCRSLVSVNVTGWSTGHLTGSYNTCTLFDGCQSLTTITGLSGWNTSKMQDFRQWFTNCKKLASIPTIDTSNATMMRNMFEGCTSLPATFPWAINCAKVTETYNGFNSMFNKSSVTKVTLKNVSSSIKSSVTASLLKPYNADGSTGTLTITFS